MSQHNLPSVDIVAKSPAPSAEPVLTVTSVHPMEFLNWMLSSSIVWIGFQNLKRAGKLIIEIRVTLAQSTCEACRNGDRCEPRREMSSRPDRSRSVVGSDRTGRRRAGPTAGQKERDWDARPCCFDALPHSVSGYKNGEGLSGSAIHGNNRVE